MPTIIISIIVIKIGSLLNSIKKLYNNIKVMKRKEDKKILVRNMCALSITNFRLTAGGNKIIVLRGRKMIFKKICEKISSFVRIKTSATFFFQWTGFYFVHSFFFGFYFFSRGQQQTGGGERYGGMPIVVFLGCV